MWQGLPLLWMGKEWSFTADFLCATNCAQNCYKYSHLISSPQNLWKTVIIICIFKDKKPRLRKVSVTCQGHTIGNKVESDFEFMSSTLKSFPPFWKLCSWGTHSAVANSQGHMGYFKYLRGKKQYLTSVRYCENCYLEVALSFNIRLHTSFD